MMKLVDMKLPKRSKKEAGLEVVDESSREAYPYGLQLRFDKEEVEKIKALQDVKTGAMVSVTALGKVTEIRITDRADDRTRHTVEIQIQEIAIADKGDFKESFNEATDK